MWSAELAIFLAPDEFVYLGNTDTLRSWPNQNPLLWADPSGRDGVAIVEQLILRYGAYFGPDTLRAAGLVAAAAGIEPVAAIFETGARAATAIDAIFAADQAIANALRSAELNAVFAKGGKQNQRDTGLQALSDAEILSRYQNSQGPEKKRYEKELKARKLKNVAKRSGIAVPDSPDADDDDGQGSECK